MLRRPHGLRPARSAPTIVARLAVTAICLAGAGLAGAGAVPAWGAKLIGGRRQGAIARAFRAGHAHRGQLIISIRQSTVSPAWSVVRSVRPERGGRTSTGARPLKVRSAYYRLTDGVERSGRPPSAAATDLSRDFKVAVVYAGSGSETIAYDQLYGSVCAGAGGFVDQQTDTVRPMTWSVRYVVDLDSLVAAVKDAAGPTILPAVSFDARNSTLTATEQETRTSVDAGCNGTPSTHRCTVHYGLGGPGAAGALSFDSGGGLEVGIPSTIPAAERCTPSVFVLGPSLWASGATTALVDKLGLVGGRLPSHPYRPVPVAWPQGSALALLGAIVSPCQGDTSVCRDSMAWKGTVALAPVTAG